MREHTPHTGPDPAGAALAQELAPQVRRNCHRADAAAAGLFNLCGLLLRLRNLYKWEKGLPPWEEEEPAVVLGWVEEREALWEELAQDQPQTLRLGGRGFDPFDSEGLNRLLEPAGLVYGAGWVDQKVPVFFLGELAARRRVEGLTVYELGRELAGDLMFLPGLKQGRRVFLRRQPMAYLVWDKLADPRASVRRFVELGLAGYGLRREELLARPSWEALEPVLAGELEVVLWHEQGEATAGQEAAGLLARALAEHPGSELEHFVRAVKDLLADTGPGGRLERMIQARAVGPLGFYPAWLAGFSRRLFPEVDAAVADFAREGDWSRIEEVRRLGWSRARQALEGLAPILEMGPGSHTRQRARQQVIEPLTAGRPAPADTAWS